MISKFTLIGLVFQFGSFTYSLYVQYWKIRPLRRQSSRLFVEMTAEVARLKEEIMRFAHEGPSQEQIAQMNAAMLATMAGNRELFDHVVDDIEVLHSLAYPNASQHPADCPVCISTLPALKRLSAILSTANVHLGPLEEE